MCGARIPLEPWLATLHAHRQNPATTALGPTDNSTDPGSAAPPNAAPDHPTAAGRRARGDPWPPAAPTNRITCWHWQPWAPSSSAALCHLQYRPNQTQQQIKKNRLSADYVFPISISGAQHGARQHLDAVGDDRALRFQGLARLLH